MSRLTGPELSGLREGDPATLGRLFRVHAPTVFLWARPYAEDDDHAKDLVQDVWMTVLRRRRGYSGVGSFRGWLYAVARSVFIDAVRSERSRRGRDRQYADMTSEVTSPPLEPAGVARPAVRALTRLTQRQRDVVTLRVLEGLTTRETADALECAEGTVKATLSQSLAKLRALLGQSGDPGGPVACEAKDDRDATGGQGGAGGPGSAGGRAVRSGAGRRNPDDDGESR